MFAMPIMMLGAMTAGDAGSSVPLDAGWSASAFAKGERFVAQPGSARAMVGSTPFEIIPRPSAVVKEGEWLHVISNTGDRRAVDPPNVRRVGLDGWPRTFDNNRMYRMAFSVKLDRNVQAANWVNLVELHEKGGAGAGPFTIVAGRSAYDGKTYLRVWNRPPNGKPTYIAQTPFVADREYKFVLTFKSPGWMFVELNGKRLASVPSNFNASGAQLYPQFRLYSNAFKGRMDAWFRIESISTITRPPRGVR